MQDRRHGADWDIRQKIWKQIRVEITKRGGEGKKSARAEMWKSSLWNVAQPRFPPDVKNSSQFVWTTLLKENTPRILPHLSSCPGPSRLPSSTAAWLHFSSKGGTLTRQRGRVMGNLRASVRHYQSQSAADGVTVSLHVTWSWSRCGGWVQLKRALF